MNRYRYAFSPVRLFAAIAVGFSCFATLALVSFKCTPAHGDSSTNKSLLWYLQPADDAMTDAMPIGNGKLGALVFGGTEQERLIFDEDSLWTGDKNASGDYGTMGTYQKFGEIDINLPGHDAATDYRRDLDISTATAHVNYQLGNITYSREYFASYPAHVIVARLTANKSAAYSGSINLVGSHSETTSADGNTMTFAGTLSNGTKYEAQAKVIVDGGTVTTTSGSLNFQGSTSIEIILGAGTSYVMDYARNYHGDDPHAAVSQAVNDASVLSYNQLKAQHIADYRSLFDRVKLNLGKSTSTQESLPTDARKILAIQGNDPEFEQLLYQYGRYLMISCSRPGSLPANLQGVWCDSNNPPWDSDYHTDLNIEMNYWPVETANLSECAQPLFDLVDSQIPSWRTLTQSAPEYKLASGAEPTQGFDLRASFNINGGMGWLWIKTSNAWLLQSYWEHYAFGGDKQFLQNRAYPLLKETAQFWDNQLKTLPDGQLVVPQGWSPEHGNFEDGTSFNQELVWDLFTNYIAASKALDVDPDYRARIISLRDKLYTPKIGRWGQLQEWMADKDDPNDNHRHTSNLIGLYPGHEFSVDGTPALIQAAKVTIAHRGNAGDAAEWSFAWRTAQFARTHDADKAYHQLTQMFEGRNTCTNMFAHLSDITPAIMQIDGNFGITAAMSEMLLQSQNGKIELLPALPSTWQSGSADGLCARGGFVVDQSWSKGSLTAVTVRSTCGHTCTLSYNGLSTTINLASGQSESLGLTGLKWHQISAH